MRLYTKDSQIKRNERQKNMESDGMSRFCKQCGTLLEENAEFCSECGVKCADDENINADAPGKYTGVMRHKKLFFIIGILAVLIILGYFVIYPKVQNYLQDKENQKEAQKVVDLIENLMGEEITAESGKDLDKIQKEYDSLNTEQKKLVSNYSELKKAYDKVEEAKNQKAAEGVMTLIDEIDKDSLTASDTAVKELREKYNDLSDAQKSLVTNVNKLDEYERIIEDKKAEEEKAKEKAKKEAQRNTPASEDELLSLVGTDMTWSDFGYANEHEKHMASIMKPYVYKLTDEHGFYPGTTMISISEINRNKREYFVLIYDDLNTGSYAGFNVNLNVDEVVFSQSDSNIAF